MDVCGVIEIGMFFSILDNYWIVLDWHNYAKLGYAYSLVETCWANSKSENHWLGGCWARIYSLGELKVRAFVLMVTGQEYTRWVTPKLESLLT